MSEQPNPVDHHFPFDPALTRAEISQLKLPESLRGIAHRPTAQTIFESWLRENPMSAEQYQTSNPQHWQDR